jgi:hypothetical protein
VCLEIGCHEGLTTNMLANRTRFAVGIDTGKEVRRPGLPRAALCRW